MKTFFLLNILAIFLCCEPNENGKNALRVRNNTDERIYYWYSGEYNIYHFPNTELPNEKPIDIFSVAPNNIVLASGVDPNWNEIFSQLPDELFSIYFFQTLVENQEEWESLISNSSSFIRKDISFDELRNNDYIIEYP